MPSETYPQHLPAYQSMPNVNIAQYQFNELKTNINDRNVRNIIIKLEIKLKRNHVIINFFIFIFICINIM